MIDCLAVSVGACGHLRQAGLPCATCHFVRAEETLTSQVGTRHPQRRIRRAGVEYLRRSFWLKTTGGLRRLCLWISPDLDDEVLQMRVSAQTGGMDEAACSRATLGSMSAALTPTLLRHKQVQSLIDEQRDVGHEVSIEPLFVPWTLPGLDRRR